MGQRHRFAPLRSRRANARRAVPRSLTCTARVQWSARLTEGGTVTRVGELPRTPAFRPARRCATRYTSRPKPSPRPLRTSPATRCAARYTWRSPPRTCQSPHSKMRDPYTWRSPPAPANHPTQRCAAHTHRPLEDASFRGARGSAETPPSLPCKTSRPKTKRPASSGPLSIGWGTRIRT
jgi:hypothetical protein